MANNFGQGSFLSSLTGGHQQETSGSRGYPTNILYAVPLRCRMPPQEEEEIVEVVGNNGSAGRVRRKSVPVKKIKKHFSLAEVFQSDNLQEIISKEGKTAEFADAQAILQLLKGWTIESHRRLENTQGQGRVDKVYRHPASSKPLRSVIQVREFILYSYNKKKDAAQVVTSQAGHQEAVGISTTSSATKFHLGVYQRYVTATTLLNNVPS